MSRLLVLSVVLSFPAAIALAQETPAELSAKPVPQVTAPTQELPGESLELIPEVPKSTTKPKAAPSEPKKKSSTEQASDDLRLRIRYREAKTRALEDPKLQQEWDRAQSMKTEPGKREALKSYYNLLCDRMVKIDSTVKPRVETFRKTLIWRLDPEAHLRAKTTKPTDERDEEETATQIR